MAKIELLSPAGDLETLKRAIDAKCDAVYIAGYQYGARKYAKNFSMEELDEAVKYAHLYNVLVYVTVNTIIFESEIREFIDYIDHLMLIGVDALIMQDLGMINLVLKRYPNAVIHASTQAHNHNKEGLQYLKDLGVKRVVLDRELSLNEIKDIDVSIEKEVFIHGALCVSYSGECLMSALSLSRSGNRGECAGLCRLPYNLYKNDKSLNLKEKYLLSLKELNTSKYIGDILNSNVDSLKIEGRMKSPYYVEYITKVYRRLIDEYETGRKPVVTLEEEKNMALLYNRKFTKGFINLEDKKDIVNGISQNHQGIYLGKAYPYKDKIKIILEEDLAQNDGIRFENNEGMIVNYLFRKDGKLTNELKKGEEAYVLNKVNLRKDGFVLKTLDTRLEEKIKNIPIRKIPIKIKCEFFIGKPLIITVDDFSSKITIERGLVEKSKTVSLSDEVIVEKLNKTGNTPFVVCDIKINKDENIFFPMKLLNEMRRDILTSLKEKRENRKKIIKKIDEPVKYKSMAITHDISFLIRNESQLKYLLNKNVIIYTEDALLYAKYKSYDNVYLKTSRVNNKVKSLKNERILATELGGAIFYAKDNEVFTDIYLNITNSYAIKTLSLENIKKIALSIEIPNDDLIKLMSEIKDTFNVEMYVYGRPEVMIMKYCLLNKYVNKEKVCHLCNDKYYIMGDNKKKYPLVSQNCYLKILNSENINLLDKISFYKSLGITNFHIDLYDEDTLEIENILKKLTNS